ncbi:hypothetical protein P256_02346 [Acinetobacter nectaris CIP 110549]|uniref:Major facilitator superfamily (MFS) profile domain-containing protein n=1 Tax=Acinetobacter nectaris CIP 110549 TaxID=1392540 RepID=V2THY3_9GAMM|nr:arabinose transporter [Acinetobacter nectaris]ESK37291.1 hypothetical protein P256_02346 [Acinetobacter nectaris CIP 110549]
MAFNLSKERKSSFVLIKLFPIMLTVFISFIIIGGALPVLPLHIRNNLGFGTFIIGIIAGAQFAASLISRIWSGRFSDTYGTKPSVVFGLVLASIAGILYFLSIFTIDEKDCSIILLLIGRAILGAAESFIITGSISWGLALVDKKHAGKVIAWMGTAMFAAMAFSGPIGIFLFNLWGFKAIAFLTLLLPLAILIYLRAVPSILPKPQKDTATFQSVIQFVWLPGLGAALASIGYCTIISFSSLYYNTMHWQPVWLAFTTFGITLIITRMFLGHLPDQFRGAVIALIFVFVQALGLFVMWEAKNALTASVGAALAGLGYSLVYPGLGVEAMAKATSQNRGIAMGIYTAFLDVAMALGGPMLGLIGGSFGVAHIFLISAFIVLSTSIVIVILLKRSAVLI